MEMKTSIKPSGWSRISQREGANFQITQHLDCLALNLLQGYLNVHANTISNEYNQ